MEKLLKQMLDHIFWGCFGVSHASHVTATMAKSLQSCPTLCDPIPGWSQKFLSSHKDDIGDGKEEEKERTGIKDSRIKEELEITGVKQLAEKLAMAADLLKYSPHSEITDVIWGICVSICKLLLSMPFSFSLLPTNSSLLPVHPLPEGTFSSFTKRELVPLYLTMAIYYPILEEKHLYTSCP